MLKRMMELVELVVVVELVLVLVLLVLLVLLVPAASSPLEPGLSALHLVSPQKSSCRCCQTRY